MSRKIENTKLSPSEALKSIVSSAGDNDRLKSEILSELQTEMINKGFTEEEISLLWDEILLRLDNIDSNDETGVFKENRELFSFIQKFEEDGVSLEEALYAKLVAASREEMEFFDETPGSLPHEKESMQNVDLKKGKGLADGARVYADSALSESLSTPNSPTTNKVEDDIFISEKIQEEISASQLCALSDGENDEKITISSSFFSTSSAVEEEGSMQQGVSSLNSNTKHMRIDRDEGTE